MGASLKRPREPIGDGTGRENSIAETDRQNAKLGAPPPGPIPRLPTRDGRPRELPRGVITRIGRELLQGCAFGRYPLQVAFKGNQLANLGQKLHRVCVYIALFGLV